MDSGDSAASSMYVQFQCNQWKEMCVRKRARARHGFTMYDIGELVELYISGMCMYDFL